MRRGTIFLAIILLSLAVLPSAAFAATLMEQRTIVLSEAPPDNTYLAGADVTIAAPLPADLMAAAGTVNVYAPIAGDAMLAGGTVSIEKPITGDARIVGGTVAVKNTVGGDLIIAGGTVVVSGTVGDIQIAGGTVAVTATSTGPVTIYGSDVTLAGTYDKDVRIIASDRVTIGAGTVIHGAFAYNAPQEATIPDGVTVDGGVKYIGSSSYLPTAKEAQTFAVAGAGVFLVVRILAALIAAGVLAGLFPVFTEQVADRVLFRTTGRFVLLALLGFAVFVAAPILVLLLLVSFVGAGLAFVIGAGYALFLLMSYLYAGVLAGAALARGLMKRPRITWRDAVLGTLVLQLVAIIPVVGGIVAFVLAAAAGGAIVTIAYGFAFSRTSEELG